MSQNRLFVLLPAAVVLLAAGFAMGADSCCVPACNGAGACGGVQLVEQTIMVPTWVTEKQKVTVTEYTEVPKTRKVMVEKWVPVTEKKVITETIMDQQMVTKVVDVVVCKPVTKTVARQYQVCVPVWVEKVVDVTVMEAKDVVRKGTQKVCKFVEAKEKVKVQKDNGHWETKMVPAGVCGVSRGCRRSCGGCCTPCCSPCGGAGAAMVCQKVWVPAIVEEEVEVTVCKQVVVDEPYEFTETVCTPVTKKQNVKVCEYKTETKTVTCDVCTYETAVEKREVKCCVCVPKEVKRECEVTTCKLVKEEQTENYVECVAKDVVKEMDVTVCKMVAKKVQVPVGSGAGYGCGRVCGRRSCCGC